MILYFRILIGLLLVIPTSWQMISKKNKAIDQAEKYYMETDFEEAVRGHLILLEELDIRSSEAKFNLALSYQNNGQEADAEKTYNEISGSSHAFLPSFASNQIGVLQGREEKYEEALESFKQALLKNPDNDIARYNYELLSRWLEQNEEEDEDKDKDPSEDEDRMQPSNYAKRMKAQADELVDQFRFNEALNTMNKALEIDETVAYYNEFINNLNDVSEINEN